MAFKKPSLVIPLNGTGTEIPSLDVTALAERYIFTGAVTAIGNYAIVPTGTPEYGTTYSFLYNATLDITTNGTTFSLFGKSITQEQLLKTWVADCVYNGTSWLFNLKMSFTESGIISSANLGQVIDSSNIVNDSIDLSTKATDLSLTNIKIAANTIDLAAKSVALSLTNTEIANATIDVSTKAVLNSVTNATLSQMADQTLKGNISGGAADPSDITISTLVNNNAWGLSGNSGTATGANFLGTTDAVNLLFKTNNIESGHVTIGTVNVALGYNPLSVFSVAYQCVAVGALTLTNKTTGYGATAIGHSSLLNEVSGSYNTGIGAYSANTLSTGIENTCVGALSGNLLDTGNYNTYIGVNADGSSTNSLNRIALGHNAQATANYQFALPSNVTSWQIRGNSFTLPASDGAAKAALVTDGSKVLSFGSVIDSGIYTPSLTNGTNVAASTAYPCQWMRVGSTVTISGKVDIDITANAAFELGMSLPVASNFANDYECSGTCVSIIPTDTLYIKADTSNNRASFNGNDNDLTNHGHYFTFTYTII